MFPVSYRVHSVQPPPHTPRDPLLQHGSQRHQEYLDPAWQSTPPRVPGSSMAVNATKSTWIQHGSQRHQEYLDPAWQSTPPRVPGSSMAVNVTKSTWIQHGSQRHQEYLDPAARVWLRTEKVVSPPHQLTQHSSPPSLTS